MNSTQVWICILFQVLLKYNNNSLPRRRRWLISVEMKANKIKGFDREIPSKSHTHSCKKTIHHILHSLLLFVGTTLLPSDEKEHNNKTMHVLPSSLVHLLFVPCNARQRETHEQKERTFYDFSNWFWEEERKVEHKKERGSDSALLLLIFFFFLWLESCFSSYILSPEKK